MINSKTLKQFLQEIEHFLQIYQCHKKISCIKCILCALRRRTTFNIVVICGKFNPATGDLCGIFTTGTIIYRKREWFFHIYFRILPEHPCFFGFWHYFIENHKIQEFIHVQYH